MRGLAGAGGKRREWPRSAGSGVVGAGRHLRVFDPPEEVLDVVSFWTAGRQKPERDVRLFPLRLGLAQDLGAVDRSVVPTPPSSVSHSSGTTQRAERLSGPRGSRHRRFYELVPGLGYPGWIRLVTQRGRRAAVAGPPSGPSTGAPCASVGNKASMVVCEELSAPMRPAKFRHKDNLTLISRRRGSARAWSNPTCISYRDSRTGRLQGHRQWGRCYCADGVVWEADAHAACNVREP